MNFKVRKLRYIFLIYWVLLAYIIAALIWWFIELSNQNEQMTVYKIGQLDTTHANYSQQIKEISDAEKRKTAQYIGEGATFLLLILAGAVFVFRAVRRQLKFGIQQQNFMMALTHELKTPIAVTKLNLETLQMRKLEQSQQQKLIQNTLHEANRLNSLCNNMLLSSQIEAGGYRVTHEEINFSELVTECIQDYNTRFTQRTIKTDVQPELIVMGDRLLLQMAVNNLIDNAIKYSPRESPVSIELSCMGTLISLVVHDEGRGIATEEKKRIFDKFYRVGNPATRGAKGTGLGLYLTKKIVAEHKGNIFVTDNIPAGTTFTLSLQATPERYN